MTAKEIKQIIKDAKGLEVSFYEWNNSRYKGTIHTDKIHFLGSGFPDVPYEDYEIESVETMDEEELNCTIYANSSEYAEKGKKEVIVMLEEKEEEKEEEEEEEEI